MIRKIVAFMTSDGDIAVLGNDGTLWVGVPGKTFEDFKWLQLPNLPQPTSPAEVR